MTLQKVKQNVNLKNKGIKRWEKPGGRVTKEFTAS